MGESEATLEGRLMIFPAVSQLGPETRIDVQYGPLEIDIYTLSTGELK